jgi:hypothetical protein
VKEAAFEEKKETSQTNLISILKKWGNYSMPLGQG